MTPVEDNFALTVNAYVPDFKPLEEKVRLEEAEELSPSCIEAGSKVAVEFSSFPVGVSPDIWNVMKEELTLSPKLSEALMRKVAIPFSGINARNLEIDRDTV